MKLNPKKFKEIKKEYRKSRTEFIKYGRNGIQIY